MCLPCSASQQRALNRLNIGFRVVSSLVMLAAPHPFLIFCYKSFVGVGPLLEVAGGLGETERTDILPKVWSALRLLNFDVNYMHPACNDPNTAKFNQIYILSLESLANYAMPSTVILSTIVILLLLCERLLACTIRSKPTGRASATGLGTIASATGLGTILFLQRYTRFFQRRLLCCAAMWLDLYYLILIRMSVEAVMCVSKNSGETDELRLLTELAQRCFDKAHMVSCRSP